MNMTRENPPLVELIVELRWSTPQQNSSQSQQVGPLMFTSGQPSKADEFFMQFGARVHALGYSQVERLGMTGFPLIMYQPVFRFRHHPDENDGSLYQVGAGVFTANAVPPYQSWEKFSPVVKKGIEVLLDTRPQDEKEQDFLNVNLRYIDAFMPHHTESRELVPFLEDVLGIKITIPDALSKHIPKGLSAKPMLQLQVPMENNLQMNFALGEGVTPTGSAIMMDTTVNSVVAIPPHLDSLMTVLNLAHDAIRETFNSLIEPVSHLMPVRRSAS